MKKQMLLDLIVYIFRPKAYKLMKCYTVGIFSGSYAIKVAYSL